MTRSPRALILAAWMIWPTVCWAQADRASTDDDTITLPVPRDSKVFQEVLENAEEHIAALREAMTNARQQVAQMARYLEARNTAPGALRNVETHRQVYDRYPATELFDAYKGNYRTEGFEVDPDVLRARIDRYLQLLADAEQCARSLRAGERVSKRCETLVSCPGHIGRDDDGFYRYMVEENYKLSRLSVTSRDTAFDRDEAGGRSEAAIRLREHQQDLKIAGCILASLISPSIAPLYVTVKWKHEKALRTNLAAFRATCSLPPERQHLRNRLVELASQFPKDWELQELASRADMACRELARLRCANVFQVRQSWAIAYVTRACEVRRVTKADLEADTRRWTQASEVEKQEHLVMADVIDACREADTAGFSWTYQEPELSPDCVKKPGASKGKPQTKTNSKPSQVPKSGKVPDSL